MKELSLKHYLIAVITLLLIAIASYYMGFKSSQAPAPTEVKLNQSPSSTGPSGGNGDSGGHPLLPVSVGGVIVDAHGTPIPTATGTVLLQGPTTASGATGPQQFVQFTGGKYAINPIADNMLPATVTVVSSSPASCTFYSGILTTDPNPNTTQDVVFNTAVAPPLQFEAIFVQHTATPPNPAVPASASLADETSTPIHSGSTWAGATAAVILYPVSAGKTYTFSFNLGGTLVTRTIVVPASPGSRSTIGATFYLN